MARFSLAVRENKFLRVALFGPSGTGKTLSALQLARGLSDNGNVAVIDTEQSASYYAELYPFDVALLEPPYSHTRYIDLLSEASKSYDVVIVDSLSQVWDGEGGLLAIHESIAANSKLSTFSAWNQIKPMQAALVKAILTANCHVICTFRAKTEWEMVKDARNRDVPKKVGIVPISPKDIEYDFTLVFSMNSEHQATAIKQRTLNFSQGDVTTFSALWPEMRTEVLTVEHGVELRHWLMAGKKHDVAAIQASLDVATSKDEITAIWRGITPPLTTGHLQYREILAIFHDAKKRFED